MLCMVAMPMSPGQATWMCCMTTAHTFTLYNWSYHTHTKWGDQVWVWSKFGVPYTPSGLYSVGTVPITLGIVQVLWYRVTWVYTCVVEMAAGALSVKDLQSEVTCPLCLDIFADPKRLPCDHVYCRGCLHGGVPLEEYVALSVVAVQWYLATALITSLHLIKPTDW